MSAPLSGDLLIKAFRRPASLGTWNEEAWQALLDVARYNTLLPKLWASIDRVGILSETPEKAAILLQEAVQPVLHKQTLIRFEIDRVRRALAHLEVAIVLLKGAAYLVAELPTAKGRSMVDLDILVPREKISTIET